MRIDMAALGGGTVLTGAVNGTTALSRLIAAAATEPQQPEPIFLDFSKVDVATASYLRESILAFRDLVRGRRSTFYPVIANANDTVRDELAELTRTRGDVLMICSLDAGDTVIETDLIGELDPKQRMTFDLVREHGETDAGELMRAYGKGEGLRHSTAWNNRLTALATRGLLMEISQGRAKRYRPLFMVA
jgi:hypothetical protein